MASAEEPFALEDKLFKTRIFFCQLLKDFSSFRFFAKTSVMKAAVLDYGRDSVALSQPPARAAAESNVTQIKVNICFIACIPDSVLLARIISPAWPQWDEFRTFLRYANSIHP